MAPLNNVELAFGFIIGSVCRGIVCGIATTLGVMIFVPLSVHSYTALIFFTLTERSKNRWSYEFCSIKADNEM